MSADGQGTKRRRKIAENFNHLTRVPQRYRQTTDGRATAQYSEREREFAKNHVSIQSRDKTRVSRLNQCHASVRLYLP